MRAPVSGLHTRSKLAAPSNDDTTLESQIVDWPIQQQALKALEFGHTSPLNRSIALSLSRYACMQMYSGQAFESPEAFRQVPRVESFCVGVRRWQLCCS